MKNAPGKYNLSCVLLIAGPPSGFDRAAFARQNGPDRSGYRWTSRLAARELERGGPWSCRPSLAPVKPVPPPRLWSDRIGERAPWTDPAGL